MKMSYREKIVLLVVIIFLVILIFVMWPIKKLRENIDKHTKSYDQIKIVYDENQRLINEIPTIEKNITKIYTDSKDLSKNFIAHKENFEIDKYLQEIINTPEYTDGTNNQFQVLYSFDQKDTEAEPLEFYYYNPKVVTYPILENADVNGNLLATTDNALYKKVTNAVCMNNLEPQTVEKHAAVVNARFTKEALFKFLDTVKQKDTGVRIVSMTIDDNYTFRQLETDEMRNNPLLEKLKGYGEGSFMVEFYTMQQIQEPVFD